MSNFDEDILKDFFDEAYLQIERVETNLLELEKNKDNREAINWIFTAAHTLKSSSASVEMKEISDFTHLLEDAMDEIRSDRVKVTSEIIDTLLDSLDTIKDMVSAREEEKIIDRDYSNITDSLNKIVKLGSSNKSSKKAPSKKSDTIKSDDKKSNPEPIAAPVNTTGKGTMEVSMSDMIEIKQANVDNLPIYKVVISFNDTNPMRTVSGIQAYTSLREISKILRTYPDFEEIYSDNFYKEITYIIATERDAESIMKFATIPESTEKIDIIKVEDINASAEKSVKEFLDQKREEIGSVEIDDRETVKAVKEKEKKEESVAEDKSIDKINKRVKEIDKGSEPSAKKDGEKQDNLTHQSGSSHSILRVESSKIDHLLNLVSETVITKSTFNQIYTELKERGENYIDLLKKNGDALHITVNNILDELVDVNEILRDELKKELYKIISVNRQQIESDYISYRGVILERYQTTIQNFDKTSNSLQEAVMHVRMVEIRQLFSRFPRLIRDLSRDLKKELTLVIEGEEAELDKGMVDDLIEPLIHLVRNSVDHGIELPEERKTLGKTEPATIKLSAFNEGNSITVIVSDNGRGLNFDRIKEKAIENGLITKDKILDEQEIVSLIFEPGFSTSEKITSISGRGVGLDAVKKNINKLNGTITVNSTLGKGTSFIIRLPLTLAIIQGLVVKVGEEIYIIPISYILESTRIRRDDIYYIDNYEVINLREDVLSIIRLSKIFDIETDEANDSYYVIIINFADRRVGILVDSIVRDEDIVIKPLTNKYSITEGISGATISGDGTIGLILDIGQLVDLGTKQHSDYQNSKIMGKSNGK